MPSSWISLPAVCPCWLRNNHQETQVCQNERQTDGSKWWWKWWSICEAQTSNLQTEFSSLYKMFKPPTLRNNKWNVHNKSLQAVQATKRQTAWHTLHRHTHVHACTHTCIHTSTHADREQTIDYLVVLCSNKRVVFHFSAGKQIYIYKTLHSCSEWHYFPHVTSIPCRPSQTQVLNNNYVHV